MVDDSSLEEIADGFCKEHRLTINGRVECADPAGILYDVRPAMTDGIISIFVHRASGQVSAFGFKNVYRARRLAEPLTGPYDPCSLVRYMLTRGLEE